MDEKLVLVCDQHPSGHVTTEWEGQKVKSTSPFLLGLKLDTIGVPKDRVLVERKSLDEYYNQQGDN